MARDQLEARLRRAGELEVSGEDQAETDSYFDTTHFRFHGPDGLEADYSCLTDYFQAIRAAFDGRSIRRGIIVAEGKYIARQTWIEGTFVREFTIASVKRSHWHWQKGPRPWLGCRDSRKPGLGAPLFRRRRHPPWTWLDRRRELPGWGTTLETLGRSYATGGS
jgi:hypothetical protein